MRQTKESYKHTVLPYITPMQLADYLDALLDQLHAVHEEIRRREKAGEQ
jgi:hypothetical protein